MNQKDDIPEEIKNAFQEMQKERGLCPSAEELTLFHQLRMSADDLARVKRHIDVCGKCDWEVNSLAQFDSAIKSREEEAPGFVRRFLLNPALAYVLVLVLLYPAYVGLFQKPRVVERIVKETITVPAESVAAARDFNLGEATTQRNGKSAAELVSFQLLPDDKFFILNFFLPVRPSHRYEMQITDEKGTVIATGPIQSRDPLGNFAIVATTGLFGNGIYTLKVTESATDTNQRLDDYYLRFRVKRLQ